MNEREKLCEQLSAYIDGELAADQAGQLERALQADPELAAELARLRAVRDLVRKLPRAHAPDDFVSRVMEQAERGHLVGTPAAQAKASPLRWVRYLATAAVVLVAIGVGAVIVKTLRSPTIEDIAPAGGPSGELAHEEMKAPPGPEARAEDRTVRYHGEVAPEVGEKGVTVNGISSVASRTSSGGPENATAFVYSGKAVGGEAEASGQVAVRGGDGLDTDGEVSGRAGVVMVHADARGLEETLRGLVSERVPAATWDSAPNEEIDTDDLSAARRQVEVVLDNNGFVLAEKPKRPIPKDGAKMEPVALNVALLNRDTPRQVQYGVVGLPEQITQVRNELAVVRAQQRVSQVSRVVADSREERDRKIADRAKEAGLASRFEDRQPEDAYGSAPESKPKAVTEAFNGAPPTTAVPVAVAPSPAESQRRAQDLAQTTPKEPVTATVDGRLPPSPEAISATAPAKLGQKADEPVAGRPFFGALEAEQPTARQGVAPQQQAGASASQPASQQLQVLLITLNSMSAETMAELKATREAGAAAPAMPATQEAPTTAPSGK